MERRETSSILPAVYKDHGLYGTSRFVGTIAKQSLRFIRLLVQTHIVLLHGLEPNFHHLVLSLSLSTVQHFLSEI